MNEDGMRTLLDAGVPEPPADLAAPPLTAIHHRVVRRRIATAGGVAVVAALAVLVGAVTVRGLAAGPPPPAAPNPDAMAWTFAVIDENGRDLRVVGAPNRVSRLCLEDATVRVDVTADDVVLSASVSPARPPCLFSAPVRLDAGLGDRLVRDGQDDAARPVLPEKILPRPTYPRGLRADPGSPLGNASQPSWVVNYEGSGGVGVTVTATPQSLAPTFPAKGRLTVHGHDIQLIEERGYNPMTGTFDPAYDVRTGTWDAEGWRIHVTGNRPDGTTVPRAELVKILNGLVWP